MNEHSRLQTPVAPQDAGLSAAGLDRLSAVMQREVETGHVPGISMLIARGGKIGYRRISARLRARRAADAGQRDLPHFLDDQADRLGRADDAARRRQALRRRPDRQIHPRIGQREGRRRAATASSTWSPAKRAITVHDLLRHTSGLTYAFTGNAGCAAPLRRGKAVYRRSRQCQAVPDQRSRAARNSSPSSPSCR